MYAIASFDGGQGDTREKTKRHLPHWHGGFIVKYHTCALNEVERKYRRRYQKSVARYVQYVTNEASLGAHVLLTVFQ